MLLCDHSKAVCASLLEKKDGGHRVDIMVDNACFVLVTDLCLADYLVTSGIASSVVFHLKSHPTFVSDAMSKDVLVSS